MKTSAERIHEACNKLANMLVAKNMAYGDSALKPVGIFAKGEAAELIKVRIDDKLSRIKNNPYAFGEDAVNDLLGYLILLQLATENENVIKLQAANKQAELYKETCKKAGSKL